MMQFYYLYCELIQGTVKNIDEPCDNFYDSKIKKYFFYFLKMFLMNNR